MSKTLGKAVAAAVLVAALWPGTRAAAASSVASACPSGKPMVVGYFDHTAAWYRRQPRLKPDQIAPLTWQPPPQGGVIVLYSDVSTVKGEEDGGDAGAEQVRVRMAERDADIQGYLDAARRTGGIQVRIQVPPDIVTRWATEPAMRDLLRGFVKRWSGHPATAGFYLYDEPELSNVPASTLAEVAGVIRKHAPRSRLSISIASSAVSENKPLVRSYADAEPRIFDELLVNRYPVYRAYGPGAGKGGPGMNTKLGLESGKASRENLADNEFQNLGDYYDSLVASTRVPGLAGRPVYASFQAYGLRDDCDGPDCKATRERKARRSPTWKELLYMYASVWMSGVDGAVFYSRYFSLYDRALRARLDRLEPLTASVFGMLPACDDGVTVRVANSSRKSSVWAPAGAVARLAGSAEGKPPEYLVVLNRRPGRANLRLQLDGAPEAKSAEELVFGPQGEPQEPVTRALEGGPGNRALLLEMDGAGVRLFRLAYD